MLLGLLTYPLKGFCLSVVSSVTYIRQGGILLLGLLTYPLKRFCLLVVSSVTYIRQGGILLLRLVIVLVARSICLKTLAEQLVY